MALVPIHFLHKDLKKVNALALSHEPKQSPLRILTTLTAFEAKKSTYTMHENQKKTSVQK